MHVLVPYDDSSGSEHAFEHALDQYPDATVTLLHVIDLVDAGYSSPVEGTLPGFWEEWFENEQAASEQLLDDAQEKAGERAEDVDVWTETVVGRPTRAINDYAEEHDVDQIVMGSHGRSGVTRVLLGSVAEGVVRRAPVPVTIVR